jgi:hypothetical protein
MASEAAIGPRGVRFNMNAFSFREFQSIGNNNYDENA